MAEARGGSNASDPSKRPAVRTKKQVSRFISANSLFSEDGIGDTGTPVILTLAPECLKQPMQISRRQFNHALMFSLGSLPLLRFPAQQQLRVNGQRIMDHIFGLAEFGKNPQGGASRVAYSDADKQGRE